MASTNNRTGMKHLKIYENFEKWNSINPNRHLTDEEHKIVLLCQKYNIKNYTINDDNSINVNENVDLNKESLDIIPIKFNKIKGSFTCSNNNLTTLICPYLEADCKA